MTNATVTVADARFFASPIRTALAKVSHRLTYTQIAAEAGVSVHAVSEITVGRRRTVSESVATAILTAIQVLAPDITLTADLTAAPPPAKLAHSRRNTATRDRIAPGSTPCAADPALWTSEDLTDLQQAAAA